MTENSDLTIQNLRCKKILTYCEDKNSDDKKHHFIDMVYLKEDLNYNGEYSYPVFNSHSFTLSCFSNFYSEKKLYGNRTLEIKVFDNDCFFNIAQDIYCDDPFFIFKSVCIPINIIANMMNAALIEDKDYIVIKIPLHFTKDINDIYTCKHNYENLEKCQTCKYIYENKITHVNLAIFLDKQDMEIALKNYSKSNHDFKVSYGEEVVSKNSENSYFSPVQFLILSKLLNN